eukprot:scaffold1579_cov102-Skeletonema_dohrnii-CCMP3373.AAC.10
MSEWKEEANADRVSDRTRSVAGTTMEENRCSVHRDGVTVSPTKRESETEGWGRAQGLDDRPREICRYAQKAQMYGACEKRMIPQSAS